MRGLARQRNQLGLPTDYDRNCDKLSKTEVEKRVSNGEPYVIRLKVGKTPVFQDLVYGTVGNPSQNQMSCNSGEMGFEDPILLKSDGLPTYHLANVVDDHYMEITHVIRATVGSCRKFSQYKIDNISLGMDVIHPEASVHVQGFWLVFAAVCTCGATSKQES